MKQCAVLFLCVFLFCGCSDVPDEMETGTQLRSRLLQADSCSFDAKITADYGDKVHIFSMNCTADPEGDLSFTVTEPDTISGITGKLDAKGGKFTFDKTALCFDLLAEAQLSPVSAPWIMLHILRSGYMASACSEGGNVRLSIDDHFNGQSMRLDIWLNTENLPKQADILYDGQRILSLNIENFEIL